MEQEITESNENPQVSEKTSEQNQKAETNEIFIGNKPFMKYVVATIMQLKKEGNDNAIIKARGKFIARAVDVAEVAKKRVKETEDWNVKNSVEIGTEEFKSEDGKDINISTISITLNK